MWCNDGLLGEFDKLVEDPSQYTNAFLPSMPDSTCLENKTKVKENAERANLSVTPCFCANGHLNYVIAKSTTSSQSTSCFECRQRILLNADNQVDEASERSQAGYKLKAVQYSTSVTLKRSLNEHCVCAVRFCLHAAMLLGSVKGNAIQR